MKKEEENKAMLINEENGFKKFLKKIVSFFSKNKNKNKNNIQDIPAKSIETKEESNAKNEKIDIGIGSKAVVNNVKYYDNLIRDDEKNPPKVFENKENRDVEITHIATVDDLGKKAFFVQNKSITELKKENSNAIVMIFAVTRRKIVGWIKYNEVKEKFETRAREELKRKKRGFKENLVIEHANLNFFNKKHENSTFTERINNIKNDEEKDNLDDKVCKTIDER